MPGHSRSLWRFEGGITYEHVGDWSKIQGKFRKQQSSKGNDYMVPAWAEKDEEGVGVIVRGQLKAETTPRELLFELKQAHPRNSTLWALDPKTQICYTAVRRFSSVAAPSIFMGLPFDKEEWDETQHLRDITPAPARPTRVDAAVITDVGDADVVDQSSAVDPYVFVDIDGETTDIAVAADWENRLYNALLATSTIAAADGIWETNSQQLGRYRLEVEDGARLADVIESAYGEALKRLSPKVAEPTEKEGAVQAAEVSDSRPNAPRKLNSKIPRKQDGTFDWAKVARELGSMIEKSDNEVDVKAWQSLNMHHIEIIIQKDPEAYAELQKVIAGTIQWFAQG